MKDSKAIREIVGLFVDGVCSCNMPSGVDGCHDYGCMIHLQKSNLKRLLRLADRLEQKPALSKKQFVDARCALEFQPKLYL
jgi:hypothetical protein